MSLPTTSSCSDERAARVLALADRHGSDGVLVTHLADVRWICGFTGSNGLLLITASGTLLVTDGRYRNQAVREVKGAEVLIADGELIDCLRELVPPVLIYQGDRITAEMGRQLLERFPKTSFMSIPRLLDSERARKEQQEIACIRRALSISEAVLLRVPDMLRKGVTEREVAAEVDYRQRLLGADGLAFETIVAFGENAALPHARPGNRELRDGDCVLIDTGCRVEGYVSDITRNYVFGLPDESYLAVYDVVHTALENAVRAASGSIPTGNLDGVARTTIESAGYGEYFSHSLGHGIGLEIHEWPRIAKSSEYDLPTDAVVTLEPGVYIPGRFGIRIENVVVIKADSAVCLNEMPTAITLVNP